MQDVLRDYQKIGRDFLKSRKTAMLLDDPGLGKTIQVLSAAFDLDARRIAVICPAIGRVSWAKEARKWGWTPNKYKLQVKSFDQFSRMASAQNAIEDIVGFMPDILVIDEAHALKTIGSNRTKNIYADLLLRLPVNTIVWLLSGTIAPNHNGELYSHLYYLFPETLDALMRGSTIDYLSFEDRFCNIKDTPFGRQVRGSRNTDKLRASLDFISLRRRKAEVLTELPALDIDAEPLDLSEMPDRMMIQLQENLRKMGCPIGASEDTVEAWLDAHAHHIATERRAVGYLKVPMAAEWAREQLFSGEPKIILGAHHKAVIDGLADQLRDHGLAVVTGASSSLERTKAVDKFQNDPKCQVFIGQLQAAGTAITLTAASRVGIVESAWTPAENLQFICRAHRLGQNDGVRATMLYAPGTVDEIIQRIVARKTRDLAELLD